MMIVWVHERDNDGGGGRWPESKGVQEYGVKVRHRGGVDGATIEIEGRKRTNGPGASGEV